MTMHAVIRLVPNHLVSEQRAKLRWPISLPLLLLLGGKRYTAELRDLSIEGAMIVTAAPLISRSRIEIHCGTICCPGVVLWQQQSNFGIKFRKPIGERQLSEQILRAAAMAVRRTLGQN